MSDLTQYIRQQRTDKQLLLMTHVIYGYPTIPDSLAMMRLLLENGVEILEVQFPFSDPVADGPAITHACHQALGEKPQLTQCIRDISLLASEFPQSRVLLMSYLNPVMQSGPSQLATLMEQSISGIIVPDIAIEKQQLIAPLTQTGIDPVWIITPDTQESRLQTICSQASGMLYCVSRAGVTGESADKNQALGNISAGSASIQTYRWVSALAFLLRQIFRHCAVTPISPSLVPPFECLQQKWAGRRKEKLTELQQAAA
ncbi:tryptophan synthase subunit alpha [Aliamphritea spongicola]